MLIRWAHCSSPTAASGHSPQACPNRHIWWTLWICCNRWKVWPQKYFIWSKLSLLPSGWPLLGCAARGAEHQNAPDCSILQQPLSGHCTRGACLVIWSGLIDYWKVLVNDQMINRYSMKCSPFKTHLWLVPLYLPSVAEIAKTVWLVFPVEEMLTLEGSSLGQRRSLLSGKVG